MVRFEESAVIAAPAPFVFDIIHDYSIRLQWDPFLRAVRLLEGNGKEVPLSTPVAVGSHIRCVSAWRAGGTFLDCEYVSFNPPRTAAIRMIAGPWFFRSFAARMTTKSLGPSACLLTGLYQFECRPAQLAPIIGLIVRRIFAAETRRRWRALKRYAEAQWDASAGETRAAAGAEPG